MGTTCCSPPASCRGGETLCTLVAPACAWCPRREFSFPTSSSRLSSPVPGEPMARWPRALAEPVIPLITFWLIPPEPGWGEQGSAAGHGCAHPSAPQPPLGLGGVQWLPLHQQQDAGQRHCPHLPPRYGQWGSAAEGFWGGVVVFAVTPSPRACPAHHQSTPVPLSQEHPTGPCAHPSMRGKQK